LMGGMEGNLEGEERRKSQKGANITVLDVIFKKGERRGGRRLRKLKERLEIIPMEANLTNESKEKKKRGGGEIRWQFLYLLCTPEKRRGGKAESLKKNLRSPVYGGGGVGKRQSPGNRFRKAEESAKGGFTIRRKKKGRQHTSCSEG